MLYVMEEKHRFVIAKYSKTTVKPCTVDDWQDEYDLIQWILMTCSCTTLTDTGNTYIEVMSAQ